MRQKTNPQLNIFDTMGRHKITKELNQISAILDANPEVLDQVFKDLADNVRSDTGREGMSAEQTLRAAVLKQQRNLSYEELAFHLDDSHAFRSFARLRMGQYPCASVLQENIKAITESTWLQIHTILVNYAASCKLEKGRKIKVDSTVVETNIHEPSDSTLLVDGVRLITRLLNQGYRFNPCPAYTFSDHRRVMKKRLKTILNSKKEAIREAAYRDMLHYARRVCLYAEEAVTVLSVYTGDTLEDTLGSKGLAGKIEKARELLERVIDQTDRRVFRKERVPAGEKVISFFESHSDIIVKKNRETEYGHKVFLVAGASNLILDCMIEEGNPADSTKFMPLLERQNRLYRRMPRQVTADGGFASGDNLKKAKAEGIKDVAFSKKRGIKVLDMVKSNWVYKQLRNFRAGIEANISTLKRAYGLSRCNWSGWEGFKQYVWSSVISYNLLVMARAMTKLA